MVNIPQCGGCGCRQTFIDSGVPLSALGSVGDYYINCDTGEVYQKTCDGWELQCTLGDEGGAFGGDYFYQEALSPQATSNDVFVPFLTKVTPVLAVGTHRLGVALRHEASNSSTVAEAELRVDGASVAPTAVLSIASAGERKSYSTFHNYELLLEAAHLVEVVVRRSAGSGTVTVRNIKLEGWRVL